MLESGVFFDAAYLVEDVLDHVGTELGVPDLGRQVQLIEDVVDQVRRFVYPDPTGDIIR